MFFKRRNLQNLSNSFDLHKRNVLYCTGSVYVDCDSHTGWRIDRANRKLPLFLHRRYFGEARRRNGWDVAGKIGSAGFYERSRGECTLKRGSDECTLSSSRRRVPRVISKEDGIRKWGDRSSRIAREDDSTARSRAKGKLKRTPERKCSPCTGKLCRDIRIRRVTNKPKSNNDMACGVCGVAHVNPTKGEIKARRGERRKFPSGLHSAWRAT